MFIRVFFVTILLICSLFNRIYAAKKIYTIQVTSSIYLEPCKNDFNMLIQRINDNIRLEKIGKYYVLRVGIANKIAQLAKTLNTLKQLGYKSSFIRNAFYIKDRIIFENKPNLLNDKNKKISSNKNLHQLFTLLINAYLHAGELEKAKKIAKKAVSIYPYDPDLLELYGQILVWTSDPENALDVYQKAFRLRRKRETAKQIFSLAMGLNKYHIARDVLPYVNAKWSDLLEIYTQMGEVDKIISILDKKKNKDSLNQLIGLYFSLGDFDNALKKIFEKRKRYGLEVNDVLLLSNIYYSKRDFKKSLDVLKSYLKNNKMVKDIDFWGTLSDLSWMLQDFDTVKLASSKLIDLGNGREVDYTRIAMINFKQNPYKAFNSAYQGYKKTGSANLLIMALSVAYSNSYWDEILKIFGQMEPNKRNELLNNTSVAFYYVTALENSGKQKEALYLLENILRKNMSSDLLLNYIYLAISLNDAKLTKRILKEYSHYRYDPNFQSAFALAYIQLRDGKHAYEILKHMRDPDPMLLSDALYIMGKEKESHDLRFREFRRMKHEVSLNPNLLRDVEFVQNYLSVSMDFIAFHEYQSILQKAKKILPDPIYRDFELSYLFAKNRYERITYYAKIKKYNLMPWMLLSLALTSYDKSLQLETLNSYREILPSRDRVNALSTTGQPKKAINVAYSEFQKRPYDFLIYKQLRDLIVENANWFNISSTYQHRSNYSQFSSEIVSKYRIIENGIGFGIKGKFSHIYSNNQDVFLKTPDLKKIGMVIEKRFDRGVLDGDINYFSGLSDNIQFSLTGDFSYSKRLNLGFGIFKNYETFETEYLSLGGMVDMFQISGLYRLSKAYSLSFQSSYSNYYSQDTKSIGSGENLYWELQRKFRTAYPDFTLRWYAQIANYSEKDVEANINELSPYEDTKFLPDDFYVVGMGFLFGYEHRNIYTRCWRPYFSVDIGYNSVSDLALGTNVGIGGVLFGEDQLSFELDYSKNSGGVAESIIGISLNYNKWF